jgi:hypothetical protein
VLMDLEMPGGGARDPLRIGGPERLAEAELHFGIRPIIVLAL